MQEEKESWPCHDRATMSGCTYTLLLPRRYSRFVIRAAFQLRVGKCLQKALQYLALPVKPVVSTIVWSPELDRYLLECIHVINTLGC